MYARQIKELVWRMALRSDPKPALYQPRISSEVVGTADSFQSYNLQRVTYSPPSTDELDLIDVSLGDRVVVWNIYQKDLELAGRDGTPPVVVAPVPQVTYVLTITDNSGTTNSWTIENVTVDDLQTAYRCLCRVAH